MKKSLIIFLLLLPWIYIIAMEHHPTIIAPEKPIKLDYEKYKTFIQNIEILNKNIQSLHLKKEEIDFLQKSISDESIFLMMTFIITQHNVKPDAFHYYLFYQLLLKKMNKSPNKIAVDKEDVELEGRPEKGYFFFESNEARNTKLNLYDTNNVPDFTIMEHFPFNGKRLFINKSLFFLQESTDQKETELLRSHVYSNYKVHLMPTQETFYKTLYNLSSAIQTNPLIKDNLYLCDLISDFKVKLDPYTDQEQEEVFPIIVIYIPNIVRKISDLQPQDFVENYTKFIDYKVSKSYLELLLSFLINFFNRHTDCKGSGIIPRFNNKVTDMIFFAQGNGDEKIGTYKEYFEDDFLYFKAINGENFKIDIDKLLSQAKETFFELKNELQNQKLEITAQQNPDLKHIQQGPPNLYKNIKPLNLSEQDLSSLKETIEPYNNNPHLYDRELNLKSDNLHYYLFYKWLFKENMLALLNQGVLKQNETYIHEEGSGYFFFGGKTSNGSLALAKHRSYQNFLVKIKKRFSFSGKICELNDGKNDEMHIYYNTNDNSAIKKIAQTIMWSKYKIHLMPTTETLYATVYKLSLALRKNPQITKNISLRDLIYDFKATFNPYEQRHGSTMPIIVIYMPNIFAPIENFYEEGFYKDDFFDNFDNYVSYQNSKKHVELLLRFLITFFEKNTDCKGSGIVPRFNNKVTDMIFFAQGSGDEKNDQYKDFFEEDFLYFKAINGENFKIDVQKLLAKTNISSELQERQLPISSDKPTTSPEIPLISNKLPTESRQSKFDTKSDKKSTTTISKESYSFITSIKNLFYYVFSLPSYLIAYIIGPFLFF